MRNATVLLLLFGLLTGIPACVVHERRTVVQERSDIDSRIESQQRRIDNGVASGELTRGEADIVQDNLNYIKRQYSSAVADGRLTPGEVVRLQRLLDQNSAMIQKEKHNIRRIY